eukprot:2057764-Prymnesium_polylepis.1
MRENRGKTQAGWGFDPRRTDVDELDGRRPDAAAGRVRPLHLDDGRGARAAARGGEDLEAEERVEQRRLALRAAGGTQGVVVV